MAVYGLDCMGRFIQGYLDMEMESQGQGDKIKRSPGAEWLTDIRGKGKVRNDGVVAFLGGGLMGGRLWKIQMWGDSDGV